MDVKSILIWAVIGLIAGWLANFVMGGHGGLLRTLILGLVGAFVGGFLFQFAGIKVKLGNDFINQVVVAAVGAVVVVFVARLVL